MILQALADYYHRVAADPQSEIATPGFSRQKISFVVVVRPDGTLDAVQSVGREEDSRQIPEAVIVPGESKPSGSGINPCFLWDNMAYMLGLKADDPKPERTRATFEAFRDKHVALQPEIDDDGFHAVCRFLEAWDPDRADGSSLLASGGSFGVFRLAGEAGYIHDRPAVLDWWNACLADADDQTLRFGPCLITGKDNRLARLHEPKIKGVAGAQTSGAAIVSFNQDAFESYGRTQSYNAPVSTGAAFAYAVGLNHLLARRERRFRVGDATTVFWTAEPSPIEDMFGILVAPGTTEDQETADETHAILAAVAAGRYPAELGDPRTGFYILGLSANASRLSVRFWHRDTVGSLVTALGRHFADLEIARSDRDTPFPSLWQILRETARESKDIPPLLVGGLMRATLDPEVPYPAALYAAVIRRIRADRRVGRVRAGILKACLIRDLKPAGGLPVSLDSDRPEPAYQLGRLFAVLEKAQNDVMTANATIKDRFFGAASATPAAVFPRLMRMNQHHMRSDDIVGRRINKEKLIDEIVGRIDRFPAHLGLVDQGLFAIGYYHQRQAFFTKQAAAEATESPNESAEQTS